MKKEYAFFLIVFFYLSVITACAQKAAIKGRVVDAASNEPLSFVNIIVSGTSIGTTSDFDGHFIITGLTPGFIRLEASFIGYKKEISSEVEITAERINILEIMLEKQSLKIDEVIVSASPFRKTVESPNSLKTIGIGEIEKSPGANRDISKVIQSFPGVQSTPAFRNDIIIRGGGPSESKFYLDGVEVLFINHFSTQGASGGPVGIINADFLREVNYYSGAFPANRGNALSGILEFFQVDGNKEKLKFQGTVGASEVAATVDGPVRDNTSFVFSVRRSYLQFLFKLLELPFLPNFTDMQFKLRTKIDVKNELTFVGIGADDVFDLNLEIDNPDEQQQFILSQIPVNEQWSYTVGGVYKHYMKKGYQTVVLSRSHLRNKAYKYFDNDYSSENNKILDYFSEEIDNKLRIENTMWVRNYKINTGVNCDIVNYKNRTMQTRFYDNELLNIDYNTSVNFIKWGVFAQVSNRFFKDRMSASLGVRTDANSYSESMNNLFEQCSPRLSVAYNLTKKWQLNFNTGRYYQLPPYTSLGFKENDELINKKSLKYIAVTHFVFGVDYRPYNNILCSLEGFIKRYYDYPFSVKDKISLANKGADFGVIGDEEVISVSNGRAYGTELQIRIYNLNKYNVNFSYTLVRSEFADMDNNYISSSWDSKHLLNVTLTKELSKGWRIGAKWRYVGALPYTPYDLEKSEMVEAWNVSGKPYLNYNRLNAERFKPFHQLDVRIDKSFYLEKITAKFYIDIQNLYNYKAEQQDIVVREKDQNGNFILMNDGLQYKLKNVENYTGTILPTIGISIGF